MIPIKLELQAFGPFAKKQVINFTDFDSDGIFLISGKTGSGKTSIFDAICFCLYGVASGNVRDADSFKSDFAPRECVCYVEFEFIVHGKRYIVKREPIQYKLKRNGNYVKENSTSTLTLDNNDNKEIISGTKNVDAKIEEILGINADQFKKIVMLPQGEFRKFLSDDSNEKQKILRKIFSTKVLDDFTEKLRMNVNSVKVDLEQYNTRCNAYIESIKCNEDDDIFTAIHNGNDSKDIDYILKLLKNINEETSKTISIKKESLEKLNKAKDKINIPYAKEINSKFNLFEDSKKQVIKLNENKSYFDELSNKITLLNQIKDIQSIEKIVNELTIQSKTINQNIKNYEKLFNEHCDKLKLAKDKFNNAKEEQLKIPLIIEKITDLKQKLEYIEKLDTLKQEYICQKNKITNLKALICKCENLKNYTLISDKHKTVKDQYNELSNIVSEFFKCKDLTEKFISVSNAYKQKMNCFIESQAYFLAGSLKDNLPCPVCGSKNHPNPAKGNFETVSQNELEKQKQLYENASNQLKEQQTICKQLLINAEFDIKAHKKLSEFLPDINKKSEELKNTISDLTNKLSILDISSIDTKTNLTIDEINDKLNSQKTSLALKQQNLENLNKSICEISDTYNTKKSSDDIKSEILQLNNTVKKINKTLDDVTLLKDKLSSNVERYAEAISQQKLQLEQVDNKKLENQKEFAYLISSKGLELDEYNEKKLDVINIANYEKSLNEYNNEVTKCNAVINSLTSQLKDLSPINIDVLQENYDNLSSEAKLLSSELSKLSIKYDTNIDIHKRLKESYSEFNNLSVKFNEYQRLYDIANGKFSDKINFERYVLASYFNDVIKNANIRLEQMTNSRYTLNRRKDKEKGNKSSGLALEVFDAYTGASRHVNTLSGGESFKISLCLALGLADIISQNSGGIELNTMFIDEGFGSLDSSSLDAAIECLNNLKSTGRYIGIISHVSELKEKIPSKLFVIQEPQGSYISFNN